MLSLVIGSEGFIGGHIKRILETRGDTLICVDDLLPRVHGHEALQKRPDLFKVDIRDYEALKRVLINVGHGKIDEVYFLASDTSTGSSLTEIDEHLSHNILGLAVLLRVLSDTGIKIGRFALTSSRAVYGNGYVSDDAGNLMPVPARTLSDLEKGFWEPRIPSGFKPIGHSVALNPIPINIYGLSKKTQEDMLLIWSKSNDCLVNIYRLQNVAGFGQSLLNPYSGVLTFLANQAVNDDTLPIFEDGQIVRDFISVRDVATAVTKKINGGAFIVDVGSGLPTTLEVAARKIVSHFGRGRIEIVGGYRIGDVRWAWSETADRENTLPGWNPQFTFEQIVEDLANWIGGSKNEAR